MSVEMRLTHLFANGVAIEHAARIKCNVYAFVCSPVLHTPANSCPEQQRRVRYNDDDGLLIPNTPLTLIQRRWGETATSNAHNCTQSDHCFANTSLASTQVRR